MVAPADLNRNGWYLKTKGLASCSPWLRHSQCQKANSRVQSLVSRAFFLADGATNLNRQSHSEYVFGSKVPCDGNVIGLRSSENSILSSYPLLPDYLPY